MKKYTKPKIIFESFTLSTNIAGDCSVKAEITDWNSCGVVYFDPMTNEEIMLFIEGLSGCWVKIQSDDGIYNGICYHAPESENRMFSS